MAAQCLQVRAGRAVAVTGDADPGDQTLVLRLQRRLQRAAGAGHLVERLDIPDRVQLEEVDVVRLQPLEGPVDPGPRRLTLALTGLRGQKDVATDPRHPRSQAQLRV